MKSEISEVMAERVFESVDSNGVVEKIKLLLGKPYLISESNSSLRWRCPFQIIGLGSGKIHTGPGMDAIDSLLISLKLAEAALSSYGKIYKKKITWMNEEYLGLSPTHLSTESIEQTTRLLETEDNVFDKLFNDFFRDIE